MQYKQELYNQVQQRAMNSVMSQQKQPLVETCSKELEAFLAARQIQDMAVWVMVLQIFMQKLFDKATGTEVAVITDEEVTP